MAIQYPINPGDRFTVYDTNTQQPLKDSSGKALRNQKWGSTDTSKMIDGLADNIKWLIEVRELQPSYDPDTQKVKRLPVSYDVVNETATIESWEVVDLTQEEIDAMIPLHFEYNSNGIKLAVETHDQHAFSDLLVLVNESGMLESDTLAIKDVFGTSHTVAVSAFREMIVPYGLYCYTLFNAPSAEEPVDPMP